MGRAVVMVVGRGSVFWWFSLPVDAVETNTITKYLVSFRHRFQVSEVGDGEPRGRNTGFLGLLTRVTVVTFPRKDRGN